jgi:hypothetical protein
MRLSGCIAERNNRKIPKSLFVLPEPAPNAAWRFLALDCGFGTLTNSWLPGFRWVSRMGGIAWLSTFGI